MGNETYIIQFQMFKGSVFVNRIINRNCLSPCIYVFPPMMIDIFYMCLRLLDQFEYMPISCCLIRGRESLFAAICTVTLILSILFCCYLNSGHKWIVDPCLCCYLFRKIINTFQTDIQSINATNDLFTLSCLLYCCKLFTSQYGSAVTSLIKCEHAVLLHVLN